MSFDLVALLARGRTTAVRVEVAGRCLRFHMPQQDEEIPKPLVESLVPPGDTRTSAIIDRGVGAEADVGNVKAQGDRGTRTDGWSKTQRVPKGELPTRKDTRPGRDGNVRDVRIPPSAVVSRIDIIKGRGSA